MTYGPSRAGTTPGAACPILPWVGTGAEIRKFPSHGNGAAAAWLVCCLYVSRRAHLVPSEKPHPSAAAWLRLSTVPASGGLAHGVLLPFPSGSPVLRQTLCYSTNKDDDPS